MNSRLIYFIFVGLLFSRLVAIADDVGLQYIKVFQTIDLDLNSEEGILVVKDRATYSTNRYFEAENSSKGENTLMLHANTFAEMQKGEAVTVLRKEADVTVSAGMCLRVVKGNLKTGSMYHLYLKLNDKLPPRFDVSVDYSIAVDKNQTSIELIYQPVFENEEFMPPIWFSDHSYCIKIKRPNGYQIGSLTKNDIKNENEYIRVFIRNSDPVRLQFIKTRN